MGSLRAWLRRAAAAVVATLVAAPLTVGVQSSAFGRDVVEDPWGSDLSVTPRLGDDDVVATAVAVSRARFADDATSLVVLSRDDVFADALAATPMLADAPLLLTASASLDARTRSEIGRVLPAGGEVVVLGGEGALRAPVADALRADGYRVTRLFGANRIDTAAVVAGEVARRWPASASTVLVARAFGTEDNPTAAWADSVSAGAWAAATRHPVVLTHTDALADAAAGVLASADRAILLGGSAALSTALESEVRGVVDEVDRVAGSGRDATAVAVLTDLWGHDVGTGRVALVPGWAEDGWAFGLVAAGLGADVGAPLLPVERDRLPGATATAITACGAASVATLLVAGPSAATDDVAAEAELRDGVDCSRTFDRRWSQASAWPSGRVPVAGEAVVVPTGVRMLLDVDTAPLARLDLRGTLVFDDADLTLTAAAIDIAVGGGLEVGTAVAPHRNRSEIRLTGDPASTDPDDLVGSMGTRGLVVRGGGSLQVHAAPPATTWTRLVGHAAAGATTIRVEDAAGWRAGDRVVVTSTDFHGASASEVRTVAAVDGTSVSLAAPLDHDHWGRLQYVTAGGMSLDATARLSAGATGAPTVLDERAEVGNLTRNVVLSASDDAAWRDRGFGAHLMVMGNNADVHVDGLGLRRVGQRGNTGRYPFHWHRPSWSDDGTDLGDAADVLRRSVVWESANRCITLHAVNGATVADNICLDVDGHALFMEDAVERRNTITGNLVVDVHNPPVPLKVHETDIFQGGASGFWLTNPDNTVTDNVAVGADGVGFWLSFPAGPLGASTAVDVRPQQVAVREFADNVAHSNRKLGLNLDWVVVDDAGNVAPQSFVPKSDEGASGETYDHERWLRAPIERFTTYKHGQGGMWNRVAWPDYTGWVSADNVGTFFAGAGADGLITDTLVVAESLNNATTWESTRDASWIGGPVAFASYHSTFDIADNLAVGFSFRDGEASGVFKTDDYYVRPVDKGHLRSPGNVLVDSHPGERIPRPDPSWALAGALWDPHGYWGPAGNWWVYDDPFLTHDATCVAVAPGGAAGASCGGTFIGIKGFQLDQANEPWAAFFAIEVDRQDVSTGATVGTWTVAASAEGRTLANMRHFAAASGGRYLVDFPGRVPVDVTLEVENALAADDTVVLGIRFDGSRAAGVFAASNYNSSQEYVVGLPASDFKHVYAEVGSLAQVLASDGEVFWQDHAGDVVWVKVAGGIPDEYVESTDPISDERLYEMFKLRVHD